MINARTALITAKCVRCMGSVKNVRISSILMYQGSALRVVLLVLLLIFLGTVLVVHHFVLPVLVTSHVHLVKMVMF